MHIYTDEKDWLEHINTDEGGWLLHVLVLHVLQQV